METFATTAQTEDRYDSVDNPRFMDKSQRQRLKSLQQAVKALAARLIQRYDLIAIEQLNVKNMTSAGGKYKKKGLNRSILDTAPGAFLATLKSKAEDCPWSWGVYEPGTGCAERIGCEWIEVPTRQVKPRVIPYFPAQATDKGRRGRRRQEVQNRAIRGSLAQNSSPL
jgi:hypothetical protein